MPTLFINNFIYKVIVFTFAMKQLFFDGKSAKLRVEDADDVYLLSQIVSMGDIITGKTIRKIKLGGADERQRAVEKKTVFLKIQAEKVSYQPGEECVRVTGPIIEGSEDIPKGEHHSFSLEPGVEFIIEKKQWLSYQLARLKESISEKSSRIAVCVMDRDEAHVALLKRHDFEILRHIKGKVQKKGEDGQGDNRFYQEVIGTLQEYVTRFNLVRILLASPAFWKEDLLKEIKDKELKGKIILATCNAVGKNGINEVLRRPEVAEALHQERVAEESALVEEMLSGIARKGRAAYGYKETERAVQLGAVTELLITDAFLLRSREFGNSQAIDELIKLAEKSRGVVHIISAGHDAGKKLDGLGGIGALLRFSVE